MQILIIIAVNLLFFWRTIKYSWVCDDVVIARNTLNVPKPAHWFTKFWYYAIGKHYWSSKAAHLFPFVVHTTVCALIYCVFGANHISFIAALLFCLNPSNTQGGVWISGKPYSISTLLVLLMWGFKPWVSIWFYFAATYFFSFNALFSSLIFLLSPFPYFALFTPLNILRERASIFKKGDPNHKVNLESNAELLTVAPRKIITYIKSIGYNFIVGIIPHTLGFYHPFLFTHGYSAKDNKNSYKIEWYFLAGSLILIALGYGLLFYRTQLWVFGLFWFVINMSMWCNFITMNQPVALRYNYMPNVGIAILVSTILHTLPFWVTASILSAYAVRLWLWLPFYKSEYNSVEMACFDVPNHYYVYLNRAAHCFHTDNYHGAIANINKANNLRPGDYKILMNLAQMSLIMGNVPLARKHFEEAKLTKIDGREAEIAIKNKELEQLIKEVEEAAKKTKLVNFDLSRFDILR